MRHGAKHDGLRRAQLDEQRSSADDQRTSQNLRPHAPGFVLHLMVQIRGDPPPRLECHDRCSNIGGKVSTSHLSQKRDGRRISWPEAQIPETAWMCGTLFDNVEECGGTKECSDERLCFSRSASFFHVRDVKPSAITTPVTKEVRFNPGRELELKRLHCGSQRTRLPEMWIPHTAGSQTTRKRA
jgi:hypothetical protein